MSSVVESSGKFLVSRMTELSLAASHEEVQLCLPFMYHNLKELSLSPLKAAKLSSLSVEESKSCVLYHLPSRYSSHRQNLPQVDVTDLLFSVDKPIVLHGLHLFGASDVEYNYTVVVAKVAILLLECYTMSTIVLPY